VATCHPVQMDEMGAAVRAGRQARPEPGRAATNVGSMTSEIGPPGRREEPSDGPVSSSQTHQLNQEFTDTLNEEDERVPVTARPLGSSHRSVAMPPVTIAISCRAAPIYHSNSRLLLTKKYPRPLTPQNRPSHACLRPTLTPNHFPRRAMHHGCVAGANEGGRDAAGGGRHRQADGGAGGLLYP
jgi:hypothetical protein